MRVKSLCAALDGFEADVVVLTEFRSGRSGDAVGAWLRVRGYTCCASAQPPEKINGVLVAARRGVACPRPLPETSPHAHRVAELMIDGLRITGAYFPHGKIKDRFWRDEFLPYMATRIDGPSLTLGDFNTGKHRIDEAGSTFYSADCIEALERAGWVDPWRSRNPTAQEFSWFSHTGNGFRVDHAYASPALAPRVSASWYDHSPRTARVTDHAALLVELVWP